MTASSVSICNAALTMLGEDRIISLSEDSEAARKCNTLYDETRLEVLGGYPWRSARKRARLARLTASPDYEFEYAYALPNDYLRLFRFGEEGETAEFQIEGRSLLTDLEEVYILYVADVEDVSSFEEPLRQAITFRLASKLAYAVSASTSLQQSMQAEYERIVRAARSVNSRGGTPRRFQRTNWIAANLGGRGY